MSRPFLLKFSLCACLLLAAGSARTETTSPASEATQAEAKKPNVIWILLDALRARNLSGYGYERPTTPNMDKLAERGALMEQHFTQGLWTVISVPSYMTGRYFPVLVHEPAQAKEAIREVPPEERLFPEIMRENGYTAAMITSHTWFTPESRLWKAFDECIYLPPSVSGEGLAHARLQALRERTMQWLDEHGDDPYFVYLHALDTHFPHHPPAPFDKWLDPNFQSDNFLQGAQPKQAYGLTFNEAEKAHMRNLYDSSLAYTDDQIGLLLADLEARGLLQNTVIIISSDHGDLLAENGSSWGHTRVPSDLIMHVPLIIAGPGIPPATRVKSFSENVDIVPTMMDLLGLKTSAVPDGHSLMPLLRDPAAPPLRDRIFTKYLQWGYDGDAVFVIRDNEYKFVWNSANEQENLYRAGDIDGALTDILAENPDHAARLRDGMNQEIMPRWNAYKDLPTTAIYLGLYKSLTKANPQDNIVEHAKMSPKLTKDFKWGYDNSKRWLWTQPWNEDVLPLRFSFPVKNGRYLLQVEAYSNAKMAGHPASSFRIKAEKDKHFKMFTQNTTPTEEQAMQFVDVGVYEIDDESLDVTLEEGHQQNWTIINGFRLLTVGEGEGVQENSTEREEQLRALGYLE